MEERTRVGVSLDCRRGTQANYTTTIRYPPVLGENRQADVAVGVDVRMDGNIGAGECDLSARKSAHYYSYIVYLAVRVPKHSPPANRTDTCY